MINGYSKISGGTNIPSKSRSLDFSELAFCSPPQAHEAPPSSTSKLPQREVNTKINDDSTWPEVEGGGGGDGERFGVILSRTCSSASQRFKASERNHGRASLQAAVRRAFSMRKASEGYWRIHDTCDGDGNGELVEEEEEQQQQQQQRRTRDPRKKRGKFARACKKLFGF
ncbi:uncharacterized protein LOC103716620 [Phoenix dactylifera]|uniref:Uncharacterized protein LOC103716620 n=1 Tax=Phoenix dactylifera TaxID=42345 RepID=A0A8B7CNI8_PHODC|nr:uncharacterized protein LOC103716620 [Phoenix dactylifera]